MEWTSLRFDNWRSWGGLIAATLVSIAVMSVAGLAVVNSASLEGLGIVAVGVGSLVGSFVFGTVSRKRERKDRLAAISRSIGRADED